MYSYENPMILVLMASFFKVEETGLALKLLAQVLIAGNWWTTIQTLVCVIDGVLGLQTQLSPLLCLGSPATIALPEAPSVSLPLSPWDQPKSLLFFQANPDHFSPQ